MNMKLLSSAEFKALARTQDKACASVYLPTHRAGSDIQQDPIRLKNLLREVEERLLAEDQRPADARQLVAPARELLLDAAFWQHQSEGLALFLSSQELRYYRLPLEFPELVVVADRFHVKPLLPLFTSGGRFLILALSQNAVRFFTCTPYHIDKVDLAGVPTSLAEALTYDDPQKQFQFHTGTPAGRGERAAMFHGQGVGTDENKDRLLRYFQQIDKGLHGFLHEERAPLVLAGVEYLLPIYREANTYSHLVDDGVPGNPEPLHAKELHQKAWTLVQPLFHKAQEEAVARYQQWSGTGRASALLQEIVPAAYQGRVDSLFVAVGVQQWGTFQVDDHTVHLHEEAEPGDEDLLNFAAVQTLVNGGTVYAVPSRAVPDETLLAALFRY